jgi:hypothetical protein
MNSSGPISLGGATTGQSINLEVGAPATSTVSLNDVIVRQLAGVVSGTIVVPTDFYGKSLATGWFAQYLYPLLPPGTSYSAGLTTFDSDSNFYLGATIAPAGTGGVLTKVSGDDGLVSYTNSYSFSPGAPQSALRIVRQSNYDPTKLLVGWDQAETTPAFSAGPIVGYLNKSNGSISSIAPIRYFGLTPAQVNGGSGFINAIDVPNGNIMFSYSNPPGTGCNIVLNQSFTFLQQNSISTPFNRGIPSTARIYSGNTIDYSNFGQGPNEPLPGARLTMGFYDMSTLSFSNTNQRGPYPQTVGAITGSITSNARYFASTGAAPPTSSPTIQRTVWKIDRASQDITVARTLPASGQFTNAGSFSQNSNPSGDITIRTTQGGQRLRRFDSSLNNTATWDISGSAGVSLFGGTFANGYLYMQVSFTFSGAPRVYVLKIKDDFSTIASGLTATVAGFTITLTPNNAENITSYDAPYTVGKGPIGTGGSTGFTTRAGMTVTSSSNPSLVTVTKTPV